MCSTRVALHVRVQYFRTVRKYESTSVLRTKVLSYYESTFVQVLKYDTFVSYENNIAIYFGSTNSIYFRTKVQCTFVRKYFRTKVLPYT